VDRGRFVPDEITNALLAAAFRSGSGKGFVLDGLPAHAGPVGLPARAGQGLRHAHRSGVIVDNEDEAIVARTIGRRVCPNKTCAKVFHLQFKPPTPDRQVHACGTAVVQRSDGHGRKDPHPPGGIQSKALPAIQRLSAAGIPNRVGPRQPARVHREAVKESVLSVVQPALRS